ncbi:mycothiol synthase [Dactylosporangium sp. CA-139114]|uniref:mycothiol synthase n=1 Tax=Dactylosporangium sp. CA-139114 TaxID=3239931 RepID=UPI003D985D6A
MTPSTPVRRADRLAPDQVEQVLALMRAAGDTDGALPLSEHVVLHLQHGGEAPAVHLLALDDAQTVVGYAHVDTTDEVEGASAELVVHPLHRRRGLGRALVTAAMEVADERDGGRLRLWAHGDHPSASALAIRLGFDRVRVLLQLRRSLFAPLDEVVLPEGVRLRAFEPGRDDEAWLALNAAAFAEHPEQGKWTLEDLHVRLREPWFSAAGFLLAERESDGSLLGFHWTKVHGEQHTDSHEEGEAHAHEPIGEVYVLGVAPGAHGGGLGRALTLAGLWHLRNQRLAQVMLYVDESNTRAVALYQRLGFVRWSNDVSFQRAL